MGYKWDRETIAVHLNRRASRGRSLRPADVKRETPHLYYAARYHFGSYKRAVGSLSYADSRALGPGVALEWTRARVISEVHENYLAGQDLSYTAVRGKPLWRQARRLFGSWQAAVEAAGIDYVEVRRYGWGVVRSLRAADA